MERLESGMKKQIDVREESWEFRVGLKKEIAFPFPLGGFYCPKVHSGFNWGLGGARSGS